MVQKINLEFNNTEKHSSAERMENREKRARGSNWNHEQTMALAELKRKASLENEYGPRMWERIAQTLSSRFPGQIRTGAQCRRRWDTLVKVYNHIENYLTESGAQDHRELDEGELASMKLDTAYQQDWYDIVEQVCSHRRRKERCARDLRLAKRSKGSSSIELPGHPPNRDTLCAASTSKSVTHHEQSTPESTTTYAQVFCSPSLKADKLNPEEEVPRLENGSDGLVLEATQHGQVSHGISQEPQTLESANLLQHTFPAENGAELQEPMQDELWAFLDAMPIETLVEIEQPNTESELSESFYWYLESGELAAQPKEPLQDRVRDDSFETANASSARETIYYGCSCRSGPVVHSARDKPLSPQKPVSHSERGKPLSPTKPPPAFSAIRKRGGHRGGGMSMYAGG